MTVRSINYGQQMRLIKRWLPFAVKLCASSGLIYYLVRNLDLSSTMTRAARLSAFNVSLVLSLICLQVVIAAARWNIIIEAIGSRLRFTKACRITFTGLFFNQFVPASVGADLVRIWYSRRAGLELSTAINSVMLERLGNLLCVCLMIYASLPFLVQYLVGS